jgi:hypothetical protein
MDAKAYPLPTVDHAKAEIPSMQCGGLRTRIKLSLDCGNAKAWQGYPFPPAEYSSMGDARTHRTPSASQLPLVCRFELYPADYVVLIACATGDQTMFALSDADLC